MSPAVVPPAPTRSSASTLTVVLAVLFAAVLATGGVMLLSYALAADERFGIWGATLPEECRAMRWGAG